MESTRMNLAALRSLLACPSGVKVQVCGGAQVRFEEEVDSDDSQYNCGIRLNLATETYFDETHVLFGKG